MRTPEHSMSCQEVLTWPDIPLGRQSGVKLLAINPSNVSHRDPWPGDGFHAGGALPAGCFVLFWTNQFLLGYAKANRGPFYLG